MVLLSTRLCQPLQDLKRRSPPKSSQLVFSLTFSSSHNYQTRTLQGLPSNSLVHYKFIPHSVVATNYLSTMKIASTAWKDRTSNKKAPLLPLVPEEEDESSVKTKGFSLSTDPSAAAGANEPKYKVTIRLLEGGESIRTYLKWFDQWAEIMVGLKLLTNYQGQVRISSTLLTGTASTLFNEALKIYKDIEYDKRLKEARDVTDVAAGNTTACQ